MAMTMAVLAATVWFIPGWMRSEYPASGVLECAADAFPAARVEFRAWDGDSPVWTRATESADREAVRFASDIAAMKPEERASLTLMGHSLGGRIVARVLARLSEKGLKVRQAIILGAAIPSDDPDLVKMGGGSELPVIAVCNPDDVVLRYVYTMVGSMVGGEKSTAFGANGTLRPCENVLEYVTPTNITRQIDIEEKWAKNSTLKDICNHHEKFYIGYAKRILEGEKPSGRVLVPQGLPNVEARVMDLELWWNVLDSCQGWKLERNKVTGHCRIVDPQSKRTAWGGEEAMRVAFEKIRLQLDQFAR